MSGKLHQTILGATSLFDISGKLRHSQRWRHRLPPQVVDALALRSDWQAVGRDLKAALQEVVEAQIEAELAADQAEAEKLERRAQAKYPGP